MEISKELELGLKESVKKCDAFLKDIGECHAMYIMLSNVKCEDDLTDDEKWLYEYYDGDLESFKFSANDYLNRYTILKHIYLGEFNIAFEKLRNIDSAPRDAIYGFLVNIDEHFRFLM